jgi:hypothetical protein
MKKAYTCHIVPLTSYMPDASEIPSRYHGSDLSASVYPTMFFVPRRDTQRPIRITTKK